MLCQDECLREESRYHYLNTLVTIARQKKERADIEKKCQKGAHRLMRDWNSLKELFQHKLSVQDQQIKQLRKQQKDLKESAGAMTNQKTIFKQLQVLLEAKLESSKKSFLSNDLIAGAKEESMRF